MSMSVGLLNQLVIMIRYIDLCKQRIHNIVVGPTLDVIESSKYKFKVVAVFSTMCCVSSNESSLHILFRGVWGARAPSALPLDPPLKSVRYISDM